jgi:hypothetical protein
VTPLEFSTKWKASTLKERSASQSHFNDLCQLLGEPTPTDVDPDGTWYTFERGAKKTGGGDGWADVWKKSCFAWEYKGKHKDLLTVRSSTLSADEKKRLCDGIGNLKQESISAACKEFVAQFLPTEDVDFFANCYKARSDLVHDGITKRPEAIDPTKLDELVSRLLIRALTAAG